VKKGVKNKNNNMTWKDPGVSTGLKTWRTGSNEHGGLPERLGGGELATSRRTEKRWERKSKERKRFQIKKEARESRGKRWEISREGEIQGKNNGWLSEGWRQWKKTSTPDRGDRMSLVEKNDANSPLRKKHHQKKGAEN